MFGVKACQVYFQVLSHVLQLFWLAGGRCSFGLYHDTYQALETVHKYGTVWDIVEILPEDFILDNLSVFFQISC